MREVPDNVSIYDTYEHDEERLKQKYKKLYISGLILKEELPFYMNLEDYNEEEDTYGN